MTSPGSPRCWPPRASCTWCGPQVFEGIVPRVLPNHRALVYVSGRRRAALRRRASRSGHPPAGRLRVGRAARRGLPGQRPDERRPRPARAATRRPGIPGLVRRDPGPAAAPGADDPHGAARRRSLRADMPTLAWQPITEEDLDALRHLARRCLAADGGLPQLAHEQMIRRLFLSRQRHRRPRRDGRHRGGRRRLRRRCRAPHGDRAGAPVHPLAGASGRSWRSGPGSAPGGSPLRVVAETTSPESDALYADARAAAHLRRARHAPPARRDPEGQAARGPARRRLGRRDRRAVLHGVPAVVRRSAGLPGPPARRVGARGVGGRRLPGRGLPGRPRRGRAAGRLRDDHRGLDRPGRGGARVARPGPRARTSCAGRCGRWSRRAATRPGSP